MKNVNRGKNKNIGTNRNFMWLKIENRKKAVETKIN